MRYLLSLTFPTVFLSILLLGLTPARAEICLVRDGRPQMTIALGLQPTPLERHAAEEFVKYVRAMSGANLPVKEGIGQNGPNGTIHLLGRPTACLLQGDGFEIHAFPSGPPDLFLAGSSGRALLYAVYHLLETVWDVGFFEDGEYVPHRRTLTVPDNLYLVERPQFAIRQNLQGCAFSYSTPAWTFEDWQRELDWTVKKKFNCLLLPLGSVDKIVYPQFGVDLGELTEADRFNIDRAKRIVDYARSVGLEVILPAFGGGVPGVFVEKHREARYVDVKWGEAAAVAHLYPTDPLFAQVGAAFVRAFIETYGTDHVYNIDAYPETRPGASEVEQRAIKTDFARGVWAYLQAADPEAVWYMSGWTFLDAGYWPPEAVRDFFAQIPPGRAYVCDIWADANPIYRRLDYFFGHDWGFSVLHSFGGDDQLHGRFADLIARVKDVAADPRANRCVAYYINPEFVQGNPLYFELAAQLGWNPRGITVNRYLQTVARRRYGAAAAPAMVRCLRVLAESVYGPTPGQEPRYQRRIADLVVHPVDVLNTGQTIPALVEALALARKAVENGRRAVPLAAPNDRLYERDVLDLARQLIDELFNQTLLRTQAAFRTGDRAEFDRRAAQLRTLLEAQARLLAARDDFCLAPDLAKVKRQPGDPAALERTIRDPMYTFAGTPWLRDYPSRDRAELVQFYYRPRVEAYLDALSDSLVAGKTVVDTEALNARYDQIEAAWLDLPIAVADRPRSVIAALHEVWPLVEPIALERPTFAGGMARPGDRVGWREDFRDVTQWHETYSGGIFASDGEVATLTSETKWCLVGTDLDVSLSDFPVLSFRCRCDPGARGAAWLWATWVDAAGHEVRSLVWNQGTHTDWTEVSLDLEAILSLIGDPVTLRRLEINNQDPPHVSRWDWLQLSSRG